MDRAALALAIVATVFSAVDAVALMVVFFAIGRRPRP
jgi:hypothetical protein